MQFVKVRHADGREADITPAEVAFYKSIGFKAVDGAEPLVAPAPPAVSGDPAAAGGPLAVANGTDQRLDLVLDELRGLRSDLAGSFGTVEGVELESLPALGLNLDPLLDEIRGLRADLAGHRESKPVADGEPIELKEPATVAPDTAVPSDPAKAEKKPKP